MMLTRIEDQVAVHYGRGGLLRDILKGLEAVGADPEHPEPAALAPVDEFHTAGRAMTIKALGMTSLRAGMHVLDAGSGIGGTARVLAAEHGCRVTGIDLTPEYVEVARALSERTGLAGRCEFHLGSATDLPFRDGAFDAAVTFHVAMNIGDRPKLYRELARVLAAGAPFCVFDVMKGPAPGMVFPVPWAESEATSFLKSPAETRQLLEEAGFDVETQESVRDFAIRFFADVLARAKGAGGPPPLGLHLLMGENAREKFANYMQALEAHQVDPVIMIARRR